jgi:putative transposase
MAAIVHPLLTLLASLTRQELAQQVTYLKAENAILRSKLPDRITLNNQERRRLVRHGKKLGPRIKELISIVSYSTFRRWIRTMEGGPTKRPKSKAWVQMGTAHCEADLTAAVG